MLLTFISFVIVLGILVFFHELGHYWVARRNGIVVEEFGMGYPPRLAKLFTYDGTLFTLNLIPFGGFARMKGEDAGDMTPGSFNHASRGARAATLVAGPAMNAILAIFLFAASFMAGFPAIVGFPQVTEIAPGSSAANIGVESDDILLKFGSQSFHVSALTDLQYDVIPDELPDSSAASSLVVSRDGTVVELPIPAEIEMQDVLEDLSYTPVLVTEIMMIAEESPAELSGLLPGDLVYSVNGSAVTLDYPLNEAIQQFIGQEISMTVLRDQEWVGINVTPRVNPPEGQGAMGVQIGRLSTLATLPPVQAMWQGIMSTGEYVLLVLRLPVMLILGQMSASDAQLSGPVGIAQMIGGAVSATLETGLWFPVFRLAAVLSAALAITNMLPLPALDGGRLLFILFEAMRGRRVNPEREGMIHMVGFMLLLGLLVFITVRDITTVQQGIDWLTLLGQ